MNKIYEKTYADLKRMIDAIDKDCNNMVEFSVYHVYGDDALVSYNDRCGKTEKSCKQYDHINDSRRGREYHHTVLRAVYYDTSGELVRIKDTFTVEQYGASDNKFLRDRIDNITRLKSIRPVAERHVSSVRMNPCKLSDIFIRKTALKCKTIDAFTNSISKHTRDQSLCTDSVNNVIMLPNIRTYVHKCNDNMPKGKVFDYIDIECPVMLRGRSRDEMICLIKELRDEIDAKVLIRLKKALRPYKVPVGFIKLDNITYTTQNMLVYKFSLKELKTDDEKE